MSGIVIDTQKCIGCGKCVRTCSSHGLKLENRKAVTTDSCTMCGICVSSCRFGAISLQKTAPVEESGGPKLEDYRDIWVFAQVDSAGAILPVAFELLGKGRELADAKGCRLVAVLGEGPQDAAGTADAAGAAGAAGASADNAALLAAYGADEVICCRDERLAQFEVEAYALWICSLVRSRLPEVLLFGATNFGRELAPSVAARLRTGLTADCTVLRMDPETGLLQQTRPAFGGNLMATIVCPNHRPQMATVRAGVLQAPEPDFGRTAVVTRTTLEAAAASAQRVSLVQTISQQDQESIVDAQVLVVVGRGIGSQKNIAIARRLAELLGGKLGCTRPLVESGWCEYRHQVGQTGLSVAPKLLISAGVSGAIQHLAGIGGAQTVIAINSDESAPIFGVSQYSVVGDCVEVLKELVAALEASGE